MSSCGCQHKVKKFSQFSITLDNTKDILEDQNNNVKDNIYVVGYQTNEETNKNENVKIPLSVIGNALRSHTSLTFQKFNTDINGKLPVVGTEVKIDSEQKIVDAPQYSLDPGLIYLVPREEADDDPTHVIEGQYDEFVLVKESETDGVITYVWETLGTAKIDLSGYDQLVELKNEEISDGKIILSYDSGTRFRIVEVLDSNGNVIMPNIKYEDTKTTISFEPIDFISDAPTITNFADGTKVTIKYTVPNKGISVTQS